MGQRSGLLLRVQTSSFRRTSKGSRTRQSDKETRVVESVTPSRPTRLPYAHRSGRDSIQTPGTRLAHEDGKLSIV